MVGQSRTTENFTDTSAVVPGEGSRRVVVVIADRGTFTVEFPDDREVSIGRAPECDVSLDDPKLSRRHAVIRGGERLTVRDLGSSNGTRVGGRRLRPDAAEPLELGEMVSVGSTLLVVRERRALRSEPGDPAQGTLAALAATMDRVAASDINVLILGETGSGKEVVARQLHRRSPRSAEPLICINCAALSGTLLESELFGHERGAFTGAAQSKVGLLEAAGRGTVFFDEVGEIPSHLQAKLLRAIEEREVVRVGAVKPRAIHARFLAATNRDLEAEHARGAFRADLFFRLSTFTLTVPPLRARKEEVGPLARAFAASAAVRAGRRVPPHLPEETLALLQAHDWPGNVRELRNAVERALVLCDDAILPEHLPEKVRGARSLAAADAGTSERSRILAALEACAGNQTRAAKLLGISRRTLVTRLGDLDVKRPRKRQ